MELLPHESVMFRNGARTTVRATSDEAINERYSRGEVRIVTEQARYPLTAIPGMVESNDYELNPEFQRRHRWDAPRKSKLIESFIMNVPIPPIFLYEARFSFYEVMDGLQRLSAIRDFYRDVYALEGLQEWTELEGKRYSELPEEVRRGVDRRYLSSIILLHETAKTTEEAQRLKQLVFERINSGGERLTAQESRNAIYPGPLNSICLLAARNQDLCALWHIPPPSDEELSTGQPAEGDPVLQNHLYQTMGDVEVVLRFFAYRQQLEHQSGRALRHYWDEYQRQGNLLPLTELQRLAQIFRDTVRLVHAVLGHRALYLLKKSNAGWRYAERPTLTVYDPLMWAFSVKLDQAEELILRKELVQALLEKLYQESTSSFSGRTANSTDVRHRNALFLDLLTKALDADTNMPVTRAPVDQLDEADAEQDDFVDAALSREFALAEALASTQDSAS